MGEQFFRGGGEEDDNIFHRKEYKKFDTMRVGNVGDGGGPHGNRDTGRRGPKREPGERKARTEAGAGRTEGKDRSGRRENGRRGPERRPGGRKARTEAGAGRTEGEGRSGRRNAGRRGPERELGRR